MINSPSKPPIFLAGLPRSGTTWLASVLSTATKVKHLHEPFNKDHVPEAAPHWLKYLRADDSDSAFKEYCQTVFSGRSNHNYIKGKLAKPYSLLGNRLSWLPGRIMVKDVHSCMALDWINKNIAPQIVIITRHPCGLASSWLRTFESDPRTGRGKALTRLLSQPKLIEDYLSPFEETLRNSNDFFHNVALYWGATHYVLHKQRQTHPNWIFISHEDLCREPIKEYKTLFRKLNLEWTAKTDQILQTSTAADSGNSYSPIRVSANEPNKWLKHLTPEQIETVQQWSSIFEVPFYTEEGSTKELL
ncbi:sulfotransferase domain protein [Leptolyngbya sp. PCC 7375]|nr:sulfotransferase domain protein [Leptolyngbya sp. PCC 7375]